MEDKHIRNEIKSKVYESGFQLKDVANELGITVGHFSNVLNRGSIKYRDVKRIADFIGKKIEWV